MPSPLKHAVVWSVLVAVTGCGGSSAERPAGSLRSGTGQATTTAAPAPTSSVPTPATIPSDGSPQARRQALERAYDRAYDELPFRRGPLKVAQIVTTDGRPGVLDARVEPRSFFCSRTPAQRRAAVSAYYADALAKVRAQGAETLTLRVSRLTDTGVIRDVYATVRGPGTVSLTARGAGPSPVRC